MVEVEIAYLRKLHKVKEKEPSNLRELVDLIGEAAIVENTNANLRYRNKYPRVYKRMSAEVIKLGFPRRVKDHETGECIDEMEHLFEFRKQSPENVIVLQNLFETIANEEPLYVRGDRVGSGGRVAQGALDAATRYFAEGNDMVMQKTALIEEMIPGYTVGRDGNGMVTPESLARGIQTLQRHLTNQAKNKTVELLQ
jgi:hypothetical protein